MAEDSLLADVQDLLKKVEGYNWPQESLMSFQQGIEHLLNKGVQTYDELYRVLRDKPPDETLRKSAMDLISYLRKYVDKRRAVPPLLAELADRTSSIRWYAAQTLGLLNSKRAEAPLINIVLDRQEPEEIRRWSVIALSYSRTAGEMLFPLLTDKTELPSIRGELIDKMYYWWGERAIPPLIECLSDDSEEVRFWACFGLLTLTTYASDALAALDHLIATDDTIYPRWWHVRREALGAIESIYYMLHVGCDVERGFGGAPTYLISPLLEYEDFRRTGWRQEADTSTWSPLEQSTDLHIDPAWLAERLRERWPEVRLNARQPKPQSLLLDWELGAPDYPLIGGLQNDGYAVSLTCRNDDLVAEFAVWYRSIVAPEHKLFLYDWAGEGREITAESTAQTLETFWRRR